MEVSFGYVKHQRDQTSFKQTDLERDHGQGLWEFFFLAFSFLDSSAGILG